MRDLVPIVDVGPGGRPWVGEGGREGLVDGPAAGLSDHEPGDPDYPRAEPIGGPAADRGEALADVFWVLINSAEFRLTR